MRVIYLRKPRLQPRKPPTIHIMEFKREPKRNFRRKLGYRWISLRLSPWVRAFVRHPSSADALAMSAVASKHMISGG